MNAMEFLIDTILELKDIDEAELTRELSLEQLMLESLDYVEIQVLIKKKFAVEIDQQLFVSGAITTLGGLADYIEARAQAPARAAA
jgi:acyl carrier protein